MEFKRQNPSVDWITFDDHPIIREKSKEVKLPLSDEQIDVIEKLMSYVDYSFEERAKDFKIRPGIGMASIQVGHLYQIAYIHFQENGNEHKYLFANPVIIEESPIKAYLEHGEGCLSVACDYEGYVPRSSKIKVKLLNLFTLKEEVVEAQDFLAIVFQHEIDHLQGKLFYDRINKFNKHATQNNWVKIQ